MTTYRTPQEVFDFALTKIREQGRASVENGACAYRAKNGDRCVIGWMIPDSVYNSRMEGDGISRLVRQFPGAIPEEYLGRDNSNQLLLFQLQRVHDQSWSVVSFTGGSFMHKFEELMRDMAVKFGLTYTPRRGE